MGIRNHWRKDEGRSFSIDEGVVSSYFNKKQCLVFTDESARKEEVAILPYLSVTEQSKVLDLGCGDGRWARILVPKCDEYVGLDLAEKFVEKAEQDYGGQGARFYCCRAQDYVDDNQYDLILAIGLITYMNDEDIRKMVRNCSQMLAQGGRLVVRSVTLKTDGANREVYSYKPNIFMRLLGKAAYEVIRRSVDEEVALFDAFDTEYVGQIERTGYEFYVFKQRLS